MLNIKNNILKIFIICLSFFSVYCPPFVTINLPKYINQPIRIVGFIIILTLYLLNIIKTKKISILMFSTIILSIYLCFISLLNNASFSLNSYRTINLICSVAISEYFYFNTDEDRKNDYLFTILIMLYIYLVLEIIISFISLFNNGYFIYVIYSNRNNMFVFHLPIVIISKLLFDNKEYSKYKPFFLICLGTVLLFNLITRCFTSSVALVSILIYDYYLQRTKNVFKIQVNSIFMIAALMIIFYTIFYYGTNSIVLKWIATIFSRQTSINDRAVFFDYAKIQFLKNPIFGVGYKDYGQMYQILKHSISCHNNIFEILINGGIIGLFFYFASNFIVIEKAKKICSKYAAYVVFVIFMLSIRNMFETLSLHFIFFNFGLLYFKKI